jgi:hypothetical protein
MWKKSVLADFMVLSRNLRGGTDENHEEPQTGQSVFAPRFEPVPHEYESDHWTMTLGEVSLHYT